MRMISNQQARLSTLKRMPAPSEMSAGQFPPAPVSLPSLFKSGCRSTLGVGLCSQHIVWVFVL